MPRQHKEWVILLTDRTATGAPIRGLSRHGPFATTRAANLRTFRRKEDARRAWHDATKIRPDLAKFFGSIVER